jgi:hypothetical protein
MRLDSIFFFKKEIMVSKKDYNNKKTQERKGNHPNHGGVINMRRMQLQVHRRILKNFQSYTLGLITIFINSSMHC